MGSYTLRDGLCFRCKKQTDHFCDRCRKYVCLDHAIHVDEHDAYESLGYYCYGCAKKLGLVEGEKQYPELDALYRAKQTAKGRLEGWIKRSKERIRKFR